MEAGTKDFGLRTLLAGECDDAAGRQVGGEIDALQVPDLVGGNQHEGGGGEKAQACENEQHAHRRTAEQRPDDGGPPLLRPGQTLAPPEEGLNTEQHQNEADDDVEHVCLPETVRRPAILTVSSPGQCDP